jgi:hypothetical protein
MIVSRETIGSFSLENSIRVNQTEFSVSPSEMVAPRRPYRLLAFLSAKLQATAAPKTIIDIGTHHGAYALALSGTPETKTISFDVRRHTRLKDLPNVEFELSDLWEEGPREFWADALLESDMIVVNSCFQFSGNKEYEFYQWLKEREYKGLLLCTGVLVHKDMREGFWNRIPASEKLDITLMADERGTGVISFKERPDIQWETATGLRSISGPNTAADMAADAVKAVMQKEMYPSADKKDWLKCFEVCEGLFKGSAAASKDDMDIVLTHFARAAFHLGGEYAARFKKMGAQDAFYAQV